MLIIWETKKPTVHPIQQASEQQQQQQRPPARNDNDVNGIGSSNPKTKMCVDVFFRSYA